MINVSRASILNVSSVAEKIRGIERECDQVIQGRLKMVIPIVPARDIQVLPSQFHPKKKGFSTLEGQARLLHDLANIELQAMELGLRTLYEFSEAPQEMREQLAKITLDESRHLGMCIQGLQDLGYDWGSWPIHTALWDAVSSDDQLLDRILIVHRYLEGSGLDAGDMFARKLHGVVHNRIDKITKQITSEEIDHVYFGSKWYKKICLEMGLDPLADAEQRLNGLRMKIPKRIEKICHRLRLQAGFSPKEIEIWESLRESFLR